jgi:hypothetical protein
MYPVGTILCTIRLLLSTEGLKGVIARARQLQPLESEVSLSSLLLLGQRGWILYVLPTRQVY